MAEYFVFQYPGKPFELFGTAHLGTVAVMALLGALFIHVGRRSDARGRRRMRWALALFLLIDELGWHGWNLWHGVWEVDRMLPLQLCSIMVWVTAIVLMTERRRLYPALYFLGIAGALQALITPDAGVYGFPHYRFFQTLAVHSGLVIAGVWVALVERVRPTWRQALAVLGALNLYALIVFFLNRAIGSNYLYVNGKPTVPSLIDLMPAWPWYIPVLEVLALLLFGLLLLPFLRPGAPARSA